MKVVKNTVPPSSVAGARFRSPAVIALRGGVCSRAVRSLKLVDQPSIFREGSEFVIVLATLLKLSEKLLVLPVLLSFVPAAQLVQVTRLEELKRLLRSTVWTVQAPETMQSFTP